VRNFSERRQEQDGLARARELEQLAVVESTRFEIATRLFEGEAEVFRCVVKKRVELRDDRMELSVRDGRSAKPRALSGTGR